MRTEGSRLLRGCLTSSNKGMVDFEKALQILCSSLTYLSYLARVSHSRIIDRSYSRYVRRRVVQKIYRENQSYWKLALDFI